MQHCGSRQCLLCLQVRDSHRSLLLGCIYRINGITKKKKKKNKKKKKKKKNKTNKKNKKNKKNKNKNKNKNKKKRRRCGRKDGEDVRVEEDEDRCQPFSRIRAIE